MDLKPRPNHVRYIRVLQGLSPEQRLKKAFELSKMSKDLFLVGLRRRFLNKSDEEIKLVYLERIAKCHNRNY
jgi:hypothetical protein